MTPHPPARREPSLEEIEATVMTTARGRAFLADYARRSRAAETTMLLGALGKLEAALASRPGRDEIDRLAGELGRLQEAIVCAKAGIARIPLVEMGRPDGRAAAAAALDRIVANGHDATSGILDAAEDIQDTAWRLRECGADNALCDHLDLRATRIYAACLSQELAAQRVAEMVQALGAVESRLEEMQGALRPAASAETVEKADRPDP